MKKTNKIEEVPENLESTDTQFKAASNAKSVESLASPTTLEQSPYFNNNSTKDTLPDISQAKRNGGALTILKNSIDRKQNRLDISP